MTDIGIEFTLLEELIFLALFCYAAIIVYALASYIFILLLARKNHQQETIFWIPVLNLTYLAKASKLNNASLSLLLIPVVNIFYLMILAYSFARARSYGIFGLGTLVLPGVLMALDAPATSETLIPALIAGVVGLGSWYMIFQASQPEGIAITNAGE